MILIVPDKFKGSLRADQVADAIESALRRTMVGGSTVEVVKVPLADGGDGSLSVMASALGGRGRVVEVDSFDALMRSIKAPVLLYDDDKSAFIEMATVCGLAQLKSEERNPEKTSTFGLGVLLGKTVEMGCNNIIVGIGGSSTNDGGEGMLRALRDFNIEGVSIKVACDVDNPLLGPDGATMVYGPQKGADSEMLERLERRMEAFAAEAGLDTTVKGGGAAGGVGAAFHKLGAELTPGWKLFSDAVGLESLLEQAETVITAEGRFDSQSLQGKLIDGIAGLCCKYRKKLVVVCGQNKLKREIWKKSGISDVYSLREIEEDVSVCMEEASRLLSGESVMIAGCDEAGRGPLAGPVYGAAVILPEGFYHPLLNDSKKLSEKQRNLLRPIIEREALAWAVTAVDAEEIDRINILNASLKSMSESVRKLSLQPDLVLLDGNRLPKDCPVAVHSVVKGDARIQAIAAASVLAKTHRDEYMRKIAKECPQYGWEENMAYPTAQHREAIRKYGPSKYHRKSFNLTGDEDKVLF